MYEVQVLVLHINSRLVHVVVGSDIAWIKLASGLNQLINLQFFEVGANLCSYKYHTVHILLNAGTFTLRTKCVWSVGHVIAVFF